MCGSGGVRRLTAQLRSGPRSSLHGKPLHSAATSMKNLQCFQALWVTSSGVRSQMGAATWHNLDHPHNQGERKGETRLFLASFMGKRSPPNHLICDLFQVAEVFICQLISPLPPLKTKGKKRNLPFFHREANKFDFVYMILCNSLSQTIAFFFTLKLLGEQIYSLFLPFSSP